MPSFSIQHLIIVILKLKNTFFRVKERKYEREYLLGSLWSDSLVVGINAVCDGISAADE